MVKTSFPVACFAGALLLFICGEMFAGGLPEIFTPPRQTEPAAPHPAAPPEAEREPGPLPEAREPHIEDFSLPEEQLDAPDEGAARIWVLFAFLASIIIILLLLRYRKGGL